MIGGVGGRIDHFLGNALLLASEELEGVAVQWLTERALLTVVRQDSRLTLPAEPGQIVSLLPLAGSVPGVRTGGLSWPLDGETLHAASTRGISNAATGTSFTVSVEGGILLVVQELRAES